MSKELIPVVDPKDVEPGDIYVMLREIRDAIQLPQLGRERSAYVRSHQVRCEIAAGSVTVKFQQAVTYLMIVNPDRNLTFKINDGSAFIGYAPSAKVTVLRIPTTKEVTVQFAAAAGVTVIDITASSLPMDIQIQS